MDIKRYILKKKIELKEYELYKSKAWKNVKTAENELTEFLGKLS